MLSLVRSLLLMTALLLGAGLAHAASPRPTLLRFVPADIGLCVLMEDLRERGNALAASPFVARLTRALPGKGIDGLAEIQQLLKFEKQIERFTGVPTAKLRDEVLGDLVVLAYKPGPTGKPDLEEGLVLLHARDAATLANVVSHVNESQTKSGELKSVEERTHRGQKYYCRLEKDAPTFYHLRGSVLLFTGQESMLRSALDLDADLGAEAIAPLEQSLRRLGIAGSLVTFWINPRAYDTELLAKWNKAVGDPSSANEAAFLKTFLSYWKALDGLALCLQLDADVSLALAVSANMEQIPIAGRRLFASLTEPAQLWRRLPSDPLFALASRLDFKALFDTLADFLPAEGRQSIEGELRNTLGAALGKDVITELLPALGADVGLILLPPGREQKGIFPLVMLALRVQPTTDLAPVDQALLSGLHTIATLATIAHNRQNPGKPMAFKRSATDQIDVRYLIGDGVFPTGVQPAFSLVRGHLAAASSPEVLRQLAELLREGPAGPRPDAVPILRVSFKAWRDYLTDRGDALARQLSESEGISVEAASERLRGWVSALETVEMLEVRHRPAPGRTIVQISLKSRWPLK